ncbi:MAG: DEAD/DEAH box helicase [Actinomycetaceae bacterium]|nr:DEAD/DEAH box helicase [Actinomycetaceae bacterium]
MKEDLHWHTPASDLPPDLQGGAGAAADALKRLRGEEIVASFTQPARSAGFAPWPEWVHEKVRCALEISGTKKLWSHQVSAAQYLHAGDSVVICTGTGSGKSLAAWLPYLSALADAQQYAPAGRISKVFRRPTALYLAPTKALAADQTHALAKLSEDGALGVRVSTADGDTDWEVKQWARHNADIVASNPDFLHHALLPQAGKWQRFLRSLDTVIVDEMHYYRGVMGAHVAWILRRLLRLARAAGAVPRVAFLSATVADPAPVASSIVGGQVRVVSEDASPTGRRTMALMRPPHVQSDAEDALVDPLLDDFEDDEFTATVLEELPRRSVTLEAGELTAELVRAGASVLTFVRSRGGAEAVSGVARDYLSTRAPQQMDAVAAYRGGYLPEERRHLEDALRSGSLVALASTSALELGIDVSTLDTVITAAWPGTVASFWQQLGRCGRAGRDGLGIFVGASTPLDEYYLQHPQQLFATTDPIVLPTRNRFVAGAQVLCAASEAPVTVAELQTWGVSKDVTSALVQTGFLHERGKKLVWNVARPQRPWDMVDLRGAGTQIQLVDETTGTVIGDVSANRADATAHPGAIYVHQGKVFQVVDRDEEVALVKPGPRQFRTRPWEDKRIRILHTDNGVDLGFARLAVGDVEVATKVISYDLLRLPGLAFVSNHPVHLPERVFVTRAVWWELRQPPEMPITQLAGALHAAEHASIGMLPLLAGCDRWDLGGLSTVAHEVTGAPTVFVFDALAGGSGFSDAGFEGAPKWLGATWERVKQCGCKHGCPLCIVSPKCGNGNEPLDKEGASHILAYLNKAFATAWDEDAV